MPPAGEHALRADPDTDRPSLTTPPRRSCLRGESQRTVCRRLRTRAIRWNVLAASASARRAPLRRQDRDDAGRRRLSTRSRRRDRATRARRATTDRRPIRPALRLLRSDSTPPWSRCVGRSRVKPCMEQPRCTPSRRSRYFGALLLSMPSAWNRLPVLVQISSEGEVPESQKDLERLALGGSPIPPATVASRRCGRAFGRVEWAGPPSWWELRRSGQSRREAARARSADHGTCD
jgi:hypothetical protein